MVTTGHETACKQHILYNNFSSAHNSRADNDVMLQHHAEPQEDNIEQDHGQT